MAQRFGIAVTTVRKDVVARLAGLRAMQDQGGPRTCIHAIDAAARAPRNQNGSLYIHPMDTLAPAARPLE